MKLYCYSWLESLNPAYVLINAGEVVPGWVRVAGPVHARDLIRGSLAIGRTVNRVLRKEETLHWSDVPPTRESAAELVQIDQ